MEKIFYNGTILTMEPDLLAPAILTREDKIEKIGSFQELQSQAPNALHIDLKHKTMLPAFIDAHGHFSSYANAQLQVSLEETSSLEEITEKIKFFMQSHHTPKGDWIVAKGYDHNMLVSKKHPTREFLDKISPNNPVILQHQSGHCGVLNSKALELLGITEQTPSPEGGVIGLCNGKLNGYLEETAYISSIKKIPMADFGTMLSAYEQAQKNYFSYGITTIQEGMMVAEMLPLYQGLLNSNLLAIDVVGYSEIKSMKALTQAFPHSVKQYDKHFKIGGYKIFLDGSPQLKTAWMKAPYKDSKDYCGYNTMSDEDVLSAVKTAAMDKFQILAHCNGDAAIQQYIDAVQQVELETENITAIRPVLIHAQLMTAKQLAQAAALHMIPSFFLAHILHWGDVHIANLGYDRAQTISPANSAQRNGLVYTFHQDAPVIEPNMLETIQCAVTRKTKSDVLLGESECIEVLDALKAITIHAAFQYFEETTKGSIKEGKQADFVILEKNPLTVPKDEIGKIRILETIKNGKTVFLGDV
ncbi:MAG: amidohydrolase [Lachnospiraceae bacterium]